MLFLFCSDPLNPNLPDSMYAAEVEALAQAQIPYQLIHFERLVYDHNPTAAIRHLQSVHPPELAIYRGWMLRPEQYAQLYAVLLTKGLQLINSPEAYRHCHYLPESYSIIRELTPRTVWLPYDADFSIKRIMELLQALGDRPLILKDYVKSRKHEWLDACYIPSARDPDAVTHVVNHFLARQADDLNEGLVFREYIPFQPLGDHPLSGMPLTVEFRCFVLDGSVIASAAYWDEANYPGIVPQIEAFASILPQIHSRFFTMDIAQTIDGTWMIVELGDAQVAGLPEALNLAQFYEILSQRLAHL